MKHETKMQPRVAPGIATMPNSHGDRHQQTDKFRPCPPSQPSGWNLARTTCGYVMQACCSLRRWRVETDFQGAVRGRMRWNISGRGAALLNSRVFFGVIIRRAITDQYSLLSFFKDAEQMDYHRSRYALQPVIPCFNSARAIIEVASCIGRPRGQHGELLHGATSPCSVWQRLRVANRNVRGASCI